MITDAMVLAAAQAMFARTKTATFVVWDLLPSVVQDDMLKLARVALEAAEKVRATGWDNHHEEMGQ